ncbi:hypothetical protein [Peribacillus sp. FSL M8-0224]|uniref:hypothetical protein n=1 Tax=Peribacillus sp. FSL M8-0224 TaxID=2921568 RepID=UPI0030F756D3
MSNEKNLAMRYSPGFFVYCHALRKAVNDSHFYIFGAIFKRRRIGRSHDQQWKKPTPLSGNGM